LGIYETGSSPYTHCVFDAAIGFVGIARKPALSPTTRGISRRIEELLSRSKQVRENNIRVEIDAIPNPESFLAEIEQAYRVLRFAATFHGPNPFDADEYFQRPLSVYLARADGTKGKAQIEGNDLNREVIQAVTKSTAATGNEASAQVQRVKGGRKAKVSLKGSTIGSSYEKLHDPKIALEDLRAAYQRVRQ